MKFSMAKFIKVFSILICLCVYSSLKAQQVNTLYFIENNPVRHLYNPSLQPDYDLYISLPVLGFSQLSIENNSLSLKDIIYNSGGQTISFLNTPTTVAKFYNTLSTNTVLRADLHTNLLGFGFRHESAFWTFTLSEKANAMVGLPKDLFKLGLYGTENMLSNTFHLTTLQSDISIYTEAALGYSKRVTDQWTLGAKLKFLYGTANFSIQNNNIQLQAGVENWNMTANGSANVSSPIQITAANNFQTFSYNAPTNTIDWLKPSGLGAGIDLGAEYQLNSNWKFSAALIDLGFINWTRNVVNYQYGMNYYFNGIKQFDNTTTINTFQQLANQLSTSVITDSLKNVLLTSINSSTTENAYTTGTTARLNLGAEYSFMNNKLSVGLLSHSRFFKKTVTEEITTSFNARPYHWLNLSLSYSLLNGRFSTFGAGFGLRTGPLHWFASADYLCFNKVTVPVTGFGSLAIPYSSTGLNIAIGMNLVFDSPINQVAKEKNEIAQKFGLKNKNQNLTPKTAVILPDKKKILRNKSQKTYDGHIKTNPNQDCHCNWN